MDLAATVPPTAFELSGFAWHRVGEAQAEGLLRVRNDESVRPFLQNPLPIERAAHVAWVRDHLLGRTDSVVYLLTREQAPAGFTLLKRVSEQAAEIGVMFTAAFQRSPAPAIAGVVTAHLAMHFMGARRLVTYVHGGNRHGLALNQGLGMVEAPSDKPGERCFVASAAALRANAGYARILERALARSTLEAGQAAKSTPEP